MFISFIWPKFSLLFRIPSARPWHSWPAFTFSLEHSGHDESESRTMCVNCDGNVQSVDGMKWNELFFHPTITDVLSYAPRWGGYNDIFAGGRPLIIFVLFTWGCGDGGGWRRQIYKLCAIKIWRKSQKFFGRASDVYWLRERQSFLDETASITRRDIMVILFYRRQTW